MNETPQDQQPQPTSPQPQPAAYDTQGRPLYYAPPTDDQQGQQQAPPQYVHISRAPEPAEIPLSEDTKRRHEESVKAFPDLNLSAAEFVISMVQRHPIGLFAPIGLGVLVIGLIIALLANLQPILDSIATPGMIDIATIGPPLFFGGLLVILLIGVLCYIHVWVYQNNKFFLTNESVIQEIQVSLFSRHEQTVSLQNIEDASFRQQGILQTMFNYGSIRLSTEGDETTYRFNYVADPKRQIAILNDAVEAFKNGRPVLND
jgi:hypothetical protein